ncbi:hypothetical protein EK21DRAFT_94639 [Setomelanomma holmii]|uniref:Uncharacterized protein n=1 Tax=Setomelanomma holmii TaxID=210430 RepID=A0A9P4GYD5_9PLEO|nr:hypothetical protein EK21DRAFT_94639 [Setomelanomma holmii]
MPLDANYTLHAWTKSNNHNHNTDRMPTEPDKHDLLGFPGVEAEHPKWYIRRLWLVAEDDRVQFPKFLDKDVCELAKLANKVVKTFVLDEDKRHEELCGDAFLQTDASRILNDLGFGWRIWGEGSGAEARLMSNLGGFRPRWGVGTDSGYEVNDEDSINLNLRCWIAARIQAKINAPSKEKKPGPSVTVDNIEQILPESASQPCQKRPPLVQQQGSSDTSEVTPYCSDYHRNLPAALMGTELKAKSDGSRSRAPSDDSFSFNSFMHTDSEEDFSQSRRHRSKRPKIGILNRRLRAGSQRTNEVTSSTVGASVLSDTSTKITIPDVGNDNNANINGIGLSETNRMKQKLRLNLVRFLIDELDYAGILSEVVPLTKKLYASSPHREPCSNFEFEFRNFNRALTQWESLITRVTASAGVTQSLVNDPLQELAAQRTFEDRVIRFHSFGPRSHTDFPLEGLTISLALFFEGLLDANFMPVAFVDLVHRLRAASQPLYETIAVASGRTSREEDV